MEQMTAKEFQAKYGKEGSNQKSKSQPKTKPKTKSNTKRKPYNYEESQLQQNCVSWFRTQYKRYRRLLMAIPNGASLSGNKTQRIIQWQRLEREGAVPGAADLLLAIPKGEYGCLFIEMKTESKNSDQQQKQIDFELDAKSAGNGYVMVRSLDEFMETVDLYLKNGIIS